MNARSRGRDEQVEERSRPIQVIEWRRIESHTREASRQRGGTGRLDDRL